MLTGIGASHGIGIGSVVLIVEHEPVFEAHKVEDTVSETERFRNAVEKFKNITSAMAERVRKNIGEKEAEILNGQLIMVGDPAMSSEMEKMIATGSCAESAVSAVCDMFINIFTNTGDELMMQRASDVKDIRVRLLKTLLGIEDVDISSVAKGTVLVAHDLTPSMTSQIIKENVAGIITETGGKTSHSAILARALEIPAVLSVPDVTGMLHDGDTVIVDGSEGEVYPDPDGAVLNRYISLREDYIRKQAELKKYRGMPTETKDGTRLSVYCNIGTPDDALKAVASDGEGIGLFRTEFLFMNGTHLPTEEEQFEAYRKAAVIMKDREVIIRTLDIGGDKDIPYLKMKKEDNPFLGYRAVRYCLGNKDIYATQLRAILRASAFGKIRIMLPLVTCIEELREAKTLIRETGQRLSAEGIVFDKDIKVGVMIETASASLIADIFAAEADFFSIGTNDLTQYTMSVDRGNPDVAYLYSTFQPSVLRSIRNIIKAGCEAGIPVGMCGEAAADPMMIPLLISFGLKEFSVNPVHVLESRSIIAKWTKEEADAVTEKVMGMKTEKEISEYCRKVAEET